MNDNIQFHFQKPEESSGYLLWQLTMLWQRKMKKALDTLDITHTQFVLLATLAWLSKGQKSVTQIDIANHSKTDRMMVSKVLRTLQGKGFITRQEHQTDTRAKEIRLTESGKIVTQNALILVEETDQVFFSALEADVAHFTKNMRHLVEKFSE